MIALPGYIIALFVLGLLALPVLFLLGVLTGSFITYRSRAGMSPLPTITEVRDALRRKTPDQDDEERKPAMPPMKL